MRNFIAICSLVSIASACAMSLQAATISIPEDFRVEPAPGSTIETITQIVVVNVEGDEIMNSGSKLLINDVEYTTSPKCDFNKVTFVLATPIVEPGEYDIVIPKGRIQDEDWEDIDEFQFSLTVKSPEESGGEESEVTDAIIPNGFTLLPSPGSEVEAIREIKLTYYDDWADLSLIKKVILVDNKEVSINGYGDLGELTLTLLEKITEVGVHTVEIPTGTFEIDYSTGNEKFLFTLIVNNEGTENPEDPDTPGVGEPGDQLAGIPRGFTVDPGDYSVVETLSSITIIDDNYGDISVNEGMKLYIDGESVGFTTMVKGEYDDELVIVLSVPVTEAGEHTIQLPAGFFNYMVLSSSKEFGWTVTVGSEGGEQPEPGTTIIPDNVTVSPAPDSEVSSLSEISVAIAGWSDLYFEGGQLLVNDEPTNVKYAYGNPIVLTLKSAIDVDGIYWITIPANSIMNDMGKYLSQPVQFSVTVNTSTSSAMLLLSDDKDADAEIFTMDGCRVNEMTGGNIYIVRKGSQVRKVIGK